jgi:eukaryotic-like serine/threonine-protein kinase
MDVPRQLGPYRLLRRLGHGGMAEVFLARAVGASGFEKPIAVKTLLPELTGSSELERLLIEEARIGARLSHRNLVQVHDLGVDRGVYYVRMDWVDGTDLAALDRAGPLGVELVLLVAEEVALALEYVHSVCDDGGRPLGLVHRDVSPSNVLVSRHGEVKLADFGIAKATALVETTRAGIRRGKYAYMSPEQIAGEPLGRASDQFGFGVMLVELLTGGRPFDGPSPVETMENIKRAVAPDVSSLDRDLAAISLRCLAREPRDRFASAGDLRAALTDARSRRRPVSITELGERVRKIDPRAKTKPRLPTRPITE